MSYMNNDENQTRLTFNRLDSNIPNNHISHFIKKFTAKHFKKIDEKYEKKRGRPAFPKTALLNIILYGTYDNLKTFQEISQSCEYNIYYRYLTGGLVPSERTIQRFAEDHGTIITEVLEKIVDYASNTHSIKQITLNGDIQPDNREDKVQLEEINDFTYDLIKLIRKYEKNNRIINREYELSRNAILIFEDNNISPLEKINTINNIQKKLKKSKEESVFINSLDALLNLEKTRLYPITYKIDTKDYNPNFISKINITSKEPEKIDISKIQNNITLLSCVYNLKLINNINQDKMDYKLIYKFMEVVQNKYPDIKFIVK